MSVRAKLNILAQRAVDVLAGNGAAAAGDAPGTRPASPTELVSYVVDDEDRTARSKDLMEGVKGLAGDLIKDTVREVTRGVAIIVAEFLVIFSALAVIALVLLRGEVHSAGLRITNVIIALMLGFASAVAGCIAWLARKMWRRLRGVATKAAADKSTAPRP